MGAETNLWLIRHARVDGPRGVIHGPDAPADTSDAAAFAALKAREIGDLWKYVVANAGEGNAPPELKTRIPRAFWALRWYTSMAPRPPDRLAIRRPFRT